MGDLFCSAHEHTTLSIGEIKTSIAVLTEKIESLMDRSERYSRAVDKLATSYDERLSDHHDILYGSRDSKGIVAISRECSEKLMGQDHSRNGWLDWSFRLVITILVGWAVANTTVIVKSIPVHQVIGVSGSQSAP